jgi:Ca-activated chloride channel family protein
MKISFAVAKRLALASTVALATAFAAAPAIAKAAINQEIEIDRPKVVRGYEGPIYILLNYTASTISRDEGERPDLNLGLVLDRSGSMSDAGKIEYLRRAAGMAVDQLRVSDMLSVVEYDDRIGVLWPSGPVESPRTIKRLIDNLEPRGSTDLTGGMMRGVDEVYDTLNSFEGEASPITRVLLLSDGLANHGVTDPHEIRELVRQARLKGVRISTLGLGRDYDEDLMQEIAEYGGGHYYYIEHPNQMSRIFQEELMTLFDTVGRKAKLDLDLNGNVDAIELVSFDQALSPKQDNVDLADFYSGEKRTLVLRIEPDKDAFESKGRVDLGGRRIIKKDVEAKRQRKLSVDVKIDVVTKLAEAEAAMNNQVVVETALIETERKQRQAIELYEQGKVEEADQAMGALASDMKTMYASIQDDRLSQKVEALEVEQEQMKEAAAAPAAKAGYLKKSKQRLYQAKSGKRSLYVLQSGDKGLEVEQLQTALKDKGFYNGAIDGQFDDDVKAAVEAFQKDQGLTNDGIAGPATMKALSLY